MPLVRMASDRVVNVAFDNSFDDFKVAVVSYARFPEGEDVKARVYYVIYYAPNDRWLGAAPNTENWSNVADPFELPEIDDGSYFKVNGMLFPLVNFPVVRDGSFMVSIANKDRGTLSFFKADYAATINGFKTVAVASVLRDWPEVNLLTSKMMRFVAKNTIERVGFSPELQSVSDKEIEQYGSMRTALRAVELPEPVPPVPKGEKHRLPNPSEPS